MTSAAPAPEADARVPRRARGAARRGATLVVAICDRGDRDHAAADRAVVPRLDQDRGRRLGGPAALSAAAR